jgi:hypothetical protein
MAPGHPPSGVSIVEWKHDEGDVSAYAVEWLAAFSTSGVDFVGCAVCTNRGSLRDFWLSCTRVYQGQSQRRWLCIE